MTKAAKATPKAANSLDMLRQMSGLSVAICRAALTKADGNIDLALASLIDMGRVLTNDLNTDLVSDALFGRAMQRMMLAGTSAKLSATKLVEVRTQLDIWASNPHTLTRGRQARDYARIHQRIEAVKRRQTVFRAQDVPPMTLSTSCWTASDTLSAWARYGGSSRGKVDISVERPWTDEDDVHPVPPAEEMLAAYRHLKANQREVRDAALRAVQSYINDTLNGKYHWDIPPITDLAQLKPQMKLEDVRLLQYAKKGLAYVGLFLQCDWDEEHACGILIHGSRVVGVGDNEMASNCEAAANDGGKELTAWRRKR